LCVKGYHLPGLLYGKDRLQYPMKRKADGNGFERISWADALSLIAERFRKTLEEDGPKRGPCMARGSGRCTMATPPSSG
jgi:nitrate reductase NapA